MGSLLKYDKNQNTFNLSSTSNYYGDTDYNITVVAKFNLGTNKNSNTKNYTFLMKIIKQCQFATFTSYEYTYNPSSYTINST